MDYLIYFFIFFIFVVLIIFGLPYKSSSFNDQIIQKYNQSITENFESSATSDIAEGASTFYDWAKRPFEKDVEEECTDKKEKKKCKGKDCLAPSPTYIENDYYIYPRDRIIHEKPNCSKCDALKCANIDRYVLKSSVPPCPDLSNYAPKSMVQACPDISKYILKSEIPSCPKCPNMNNYVPKSSIPYCPPPVKCPTCPECPPSYKDIQDDPRFGNWLNRYEAEVQKKIDKLYIKKNECDRIGEGAYRRGVEDGKEEAFREVAMEAGVDVSKTGIFRKCLKEQEKGGDWKKKLQELEKKGKDWVEKSIGKKDKIITQQEEILENQREMMEKGGQMRQDWEKERERDRQVFGEWESSRREENKKREESSRREENKRREESSRKDEMGRREEEMGRREEEMRRRERVREEEIGRERRKYMGEGVSGEEMLCSNDWDGDGLRKWDGDWTNWQSKFGDCDKKDCGSYKGYSFPINTNEVDSLNKL